MSVRRGLLLAIGSGVLVVGVLAAADDEEAPVDVAGLPPAMREPACEAGQGVGTGHILWAEGSSFATPREALAAALGHTDPWGDAIQDFSGRFVRVGSGPNATLGREFTLEYPDRSLEVLALAMWQSDGGWLVSGHSHCYTPPPNEVADAG
jgi:hypothetical protein